MEMRHSEQSGVVGGGGGGAEDVDGAGVGAGEGVAKTAGVGAAEVSSGRRGGMAEEKEAALERAEAEAAERRGSAAAMSQRGAGSEVVGQRRGVTSSPRPSCRQPVPC